MKPILIFVLKIIATLFAVIELWCRVINALILWDKTFIIEENSLDFIWKKRK